ncbi:hypothetical protein CSA56_10300 [candidate division KSB3 bacterium]|uniref:Inositol monophosphatase n=1 Tax=candidate division KSB3 bacterium TaxID=2044937 RepID=A0A2G6KEA8_9BACT|nr:MAG: hypothetical protein CSA56_10300 [candidate division KSB3 bacterium]
MFSLTKLRFDTPGVSIEYLMLYDISLIEELLKSAGKIALKYCGNVTPSWKENQTYVTEADLAVQHYLKTEFERRFPDDGIIAEEQELAKDPSPSSDKRWIIDPIDGTASFVWGFPIWGISLGLLEGVKPVGGFFYIPMTGEFFATMPDGTLSKNGRIAWMRTPDPSYREAVFLVDGRFNKWFSLDPAYEGKVRSLGSSVAQQCYVASGSADIVLLLDIHIWDIAAGYAMLQANHGIMEYFDGRPISFQDLLVNTKVPDAILAGHPETVKHFRTLLSRR